jgi:aconitate hydratase
VARLPYSIKVVLENLLRHEDGPGRLARRHRGGGRRGAYQRSPSATADGRRLDAAEIALTPERVLMQDFTGCPASSTWPPCATPWPSSAATRPGQPLVPVELVIDHSVIAEASGDASAYDENVSIEYQRNIERYQLLRWAQQAFDGFRVVPPGTGICHQVNLEYLSRVVFATDDGRAYCDTLVGTDSHTTMVNGLGVLGWGVGGIEAEAAMLGQPLSMLLPPVVGFRLTGEQPARDHGHRPGPHHHRAPAPARRGGQVRRVLRTRRGRRAAGDRATIGNMSPEYGATCTMFPIDEVTLDYLRFTGRDDEPRRPGRGLRQGPGLFHDPDGPEPVYSEPSSSTWSTWCPSIAGPSRPQDRCRWPVAGDRLPRPRSTGRRAAGHRALADGAPPPDERRRRRHGRHHQLHQHLEPPGHGGGRAGGPQRRRAGPAAKPWVKTSLAPGSRVVMDYLERAGLTEPLEQLGFYPGRLRVHHLHRQLGTAAPGVSEPVTRATCRWPRCCRATGTSRAASTPTCG